MLWVLYIKIINKVSYVFIKYHDLILQLIIIYDILYLEILIKEEIMELTDMNIKSGKILRNTTFICMIIGCYFLSYNFSYSMFSLDGNFSLLLTYIIQELSIVGVSGILLLIGIFVG